MKELSAEEQQQVLAEALNELRWYGHQIAGGAPMVGYSLVALQAEKHWYDFTLPFLMELDAVYAGNGEQILARQARLAKQAAQAKD